MGNGAPLVAFQPSCQCRRLFGREASATDYNVGGRNSVVVVGAHRIVAALIQDLTCVPYMGPTDPRRINRRVSGVENRILSDSSS